MAELAGHWAAGTPMAETPWLNDAAQATQRYEEAAAFAVEACADDTRGQTCYICHGEGDEDEGLVRGCACRGASGNAHVSCLARLAEDAGNRELRGAGGPGFVRWHTCGLCEQRYHGLVACALGWACWKTYVSSRLRIGASGWGCLGAVYPKQSYTRTRCPCKRPHCLRCGALAHRNMTFSSRRTILRLHVGSQQGMNGPYRCSETHTLGG